MIKVFMANRPPLAEYQNVAETCALSFGEIARVTAETGNHWRKVFNVYAKFIYSLGLVADNHDVLRYKTWQQYRDNKLLQADSQTQLHFDHQGLSRVLANTDGGAVRIVMGKAFAERVLSNSQLTWLDTHFAINAELGIIVCPYFDYRQLSNARIEVLVSLVMSLNDADAGVDPIINPIMNTIDND